MPADVAIRRVLEIVERTYVEPSRLDPSAMLAAAATRAGHPEARLVPTGSGFADVLAARLEALLDAVTAGGDESARNGRRADLLDAALRTADRFSRATWGQRRREQAARFQGARVVDGRRVVDPTVALGSHGGVAVLRIARLTRQTPAQVRAALARRPPGPLLLDLRGNTGGSFLAAGAIADLFVTEGVLVEALDRQGRPVPGLRERVVASGRGDAATPLAVLVDRRTGSSAELLAACLSWRGRATLAGERTFGKNVVGKVHELPEADLAVKVSSAYMRTAGQVLPATGLEPSLIVDPAGNRGIHAAAAILGARCAPSG